MSYVCTCTICEKVMNECDAYYLNDMPVCEACYSESHETEDEGVRDSGC